MKNCNICSKVFLLDIQVPFDNCARLPITHTGADVALFAKMRRRLAMFIHVRQLIIHLLRKISIYVKTFYFVSACYTIENVSPCALRKQQLGRILHAYLLSAA